MPQEMARYVVKMMEKEFNRKFPRAGLEIIGPDLVKEPKEAMEAAYDHFVLNSSFLPSPQQLLARVQMEAREILKAQSVKREKEWEQEKGDRRTGSIFSQEQSDEHARLAVQTIRFMLSSKPTREQKLDAFRAMENQFPGVGWGVEGARLQKEWEAGIGNGRCADEVGA